MAFQNQPRLKHLPRLESMQRTQKSKRSRSQRRRPVCNKCSHTMPNVEHAHRRKVANPGTQAGAADLQVLGKLALRGNFVPGPQRTIFDHRSNVVDHLHGQLCFLITIRAIYHMHAMRLDSVKRSRMQRLALAASVCAEVFTLTRILYVALDSPAVVRPQTLA